MDSAQVIAVLCISVLAFILAWKGMQVVNTGVVKYRREFTESARVNLADIFIFIDPEKIYIFNIAFLILGFLLTWVITGAWVFAIIVAIGLAFVPPWIYRFVKKRRQDRFLLELPDTLNAMANMMLSGANLPMAIDNVLAESTGPIKQEFGLLQRELTMGTDYDQALDNLCDRMPLTELILVSSGIKISREVGGQLADTLSRLAETIRRKLEMEGKIKALTAQGKYQGIVMAILPLFLALVLYQIEPAAMARLFTEPAGWAVCAVVVVFEILGYHFIKKIVSIDV